MNSVRFESSPAAPLPATQNTEPGSDRTGAMALRYLASSSSTWDQPGVQSTTQLRATTGVTAPAPAPAPAPAAGISEYNLVPKPVNLLIMDSFALAPDEITAGKSRSHGEETSYVAAHTSKSGQVQVLTTQAEDIDNLNAQLTAIAESANPPKIINMSLGLDPASAFEDDFAYFNHIFELRHGADRSKWTAQTWASYKEDVSIVAESSLMTFREMVGGFPQALQRSLQKLVDAGVTVVIANGNHGAVQSLFSDLGLTAPAGFFEGVYDSKVPPGVIFVGASQENANPTSVAGFSSPNRHTDLIADGTNIKVTDLGTLSSGTSLAAPQVAALVADMLAANPGLKPADIEAILKTSATKIDGDSDFVGSGILNREKALSMAGGQAAKAPLVEQVIGYFDGWDGALSGSTKDGLVTMAEIQAVAKNLLRSADERAAAQQLVDKPDLFNNWERSLNGQWDELLSVEDMILWNARQNTVDSPAFSAADVAQVNFYLFDTAATATPDGLFKRDDLSRIMSDTGSTAKMKQAAKYLFENSDLFDQIDSAQDGKLDGYVSFRDISVWQLAQIKA